MATITGTLKIRPARKDDLPAIMRLGYRAFKGRAMNEAVMPLHLRTNKDDPDAEALEFRLKRAQKNFDDPLVNNLVVVDDNELIVGWANWGAPPPPSPPQSAAEKAAAEEASEAKNVATAAELPSSVDRDAWWTIVRKTDELWAMLRDALTEEEYTRAWRLDGLAVDPTYQRRGIGRMLVTWGEERALQEDLKVVRFLAGEKGAKLYRAMAYEEVGKVDILGGMEYAFFKRLG